MKCDACNTENQPKRRFCSQCGSPLPSLCAYCGFANESGARFCGGCGKACAEVAIQSAAPAPDETAIEAPVAALEEPAGERRHLTVLFCDLADSTAMSTRLDPEDLSWINRRYQETCTSIIESYNGNVARYMGDGILCYFGYPVASENDAENAIRASLEIQESISEVSGKSNVDEDLWVRIGIASGPVVVGEIVGEGAARESTAVGVTPNLAARLQSIAEMGAIMVSDNTRKLAGDYFEYLHQGQFELKGIEGKADVWKVVSEKRTDSRFEAISGLNLTPMVGRASELNLAADCWQKASRCNGQAIMLSGEPGIGKSRMIRAILDQADGARHQVLQCSPYHQASVFHPVIKQLERQRDEQDQSNADWLAAELQERTIQDPDSVALLTQLLHPESKPPGLLAAMSAEQIMRRTLEILIDWYCPREPQQASILVVEDMHWVDPSTRQLIEMLIHRISDQPLLLLASFRPEFTPPAIDYACYHVVSLRRIDPRESREMVENLLGDIPDSVLDRIIERTDGIPLFIEEISRTVQSDTAGDAATFDVPDTLADSLNARLDSLGDARRTAQAGSTIGREFERPLVAAVAQIDEETLDRHLEDMVQSGLVFRLGIGGAARYQFKHALIQDAAYASLLRERRKRFHKRAADFLESANSPPDILAYHRENADEWYEALKGWCQAGQAAINQSATSEALVHFQRALKIRSEVDRGNAAETELSIYLGLAACYRLKEDYQKALSNLERAETLAEKVGRTDAQSDICYMRGNIFFPMGNLDGCLAEHGRSLDYARKLGSLEKQARATGGLGDGHYMRGEMKAAAKYFTRCCNMSSELGFKAQNAANHPMIGWSRMYELDTSQTLRYALDAIDLSRQCGHLRGQMLAESLATTQYGELGEPAQLKQHALTARDLARKLGSGNFEAAVLFFESRYASPHEDHEEAREKLLEAVDRSRKQGHGFHGPAIIGALMKLTFDPVERHKYSVEAEEILASGCVGHNYYWYYRDAIEAAIYFKEWGRVEHLAKMLLDYDGTEQSNWARFYTQRALVISAYQNGRVDADTEKLREALMQEASDKKLFISIKSMEALG